MNKYLTVFFAFLIFSQSIGWAANQSGGPEKTPPDSLRVTLKGLVIDEEV